MKKKLKFGIQEWITKLSVCWDGCYCMTYTIAGRCGKCSAKKAKKPRNVK